MARLKIGTGKTWQEVQLECFAWQHGCSCHVCRILNGKAEPKMDRGFFAGVADIYAEYPGATRVVKNGC